MSPMQRARTSRQSPWQRKLTNLRPEGAPATEDLVQGGEVTALSVFLAVTGGLGPLAASLLGAEVTGTATST